MSRKIINQNSEDSFVIARREMICKDILQCMYAHYLPGYSEDIYGELFHKYKNLAMENGGDITYYIWESDSIGEYEYILGLLKGHLDNEVAIRGTEYGEGVETGEFLYFPSSLATLSQGLIEEAAYGTAWDAFDNSLKTLPRETQIECKLHLKHMRNLIYDRTMSHREKELFVSVYLDWISQQEEEVSVLFVPILLQL